MARRGTDGLYLRGRLWWVEWQEKGRRIRLPCKTESRAEARIIARRLRVEHAGGAGAHREPEEPRTCAALIGAYRDELQRRGRTAQHTRETCGYLLRVCDAAGASTLDDLDAPAIERGLEPLSGRSSRTRNKALGYVRSWLRWLVRTGRAERNPAERVERVRELRARPPRRALTDEELAALLENPAIHESRRLVYAVAALTGLRRSELQRLERRDLDLERGLLTVRAEAAKSRKGAVAPLPTALVARWRAWLKAPIEKRGHHEVEAQGVLPAIPPKRTVFLDLERAGIPRETEEGRVDFHALRVTFGTRLARARAPLTLTQRLMRHSDPRLTSTIYTRFELDDLRAAVERAADLGSPQKVPTNRGRRRASQ